MKAFRQEAHEYIQPHGQRALEAERRADRDHRHIQPDAQIFRTDETGVEQIPQGDIDQHHHEQRRKDGGGNRAQHLVQNGKRPLGHPLWTEALLRDYCCRTCRHVVLLHSSAMLRRPWPRGRGRTGSTK